MVYFKAALFMAISLYLPTTTYSFVSTRFLTSKLHRPRLASIESLDGDWGDAAAASILSNLGFNVVTSEVPSGSAEEIDSYDEESFNENERAPPCVVFDERLVSWLWNNPNRVTVEPEWPIVHLKGVLRGVDLEGARQRVSFLAQSPLALPIEQSDGDLFGDGDVLIRRSQIVNLAPGGSPGRSYGSGGKRKGGGGDGGNAQRVADELRALLVDSLPDTLRQWTKAVSKEAGHRKVAGVDVAVEQKAHGFEDASLVCYDSAEDFYAEHHDSWWPGGTKFDTQRAVTLLFYLESPSDHQGESGDGRGGGGGGGETEFPGLAREGAERGESLRLRPRAGDVLVWPNFDRDGAWSNLPNHGARALSAFSVEHAAMRRQLAVGGDLGGLPAKAVVNLWLSAQLAS